MCIRDRHCISSLYLLTRFHNLLVLSPSCQTLVNKHFNHKSNSVQSNLSFALLSNPLFISVVSFYRKKIFFFKKPQSSYFMNGTISILQYTSTFHSLFICYIISCNQVLHCLPFKLATHTTLFLFNFS